MQIEREIDPATGRTISKTGKCRCGAWVDLMRFTNTCDRCDTDYNSSGQRLAPRSQWGEETGESVADILSADSGAGWRDADY